MGLNTAASISFSQINSTSYFTNGNLGINTTNPTANLDVAGTIKASGLSSLASITTGALSATNVTAGVINSTGLTTGNINFTGSLFQNGVAYVGSQWTSTAGNVSYTSGSVVATNAEFTNVTYSNLVTPNVNLGVSSIFSGSFSASNNVVVPTNVTNFVFANANIRSFTANVSVSVVLSVGTSLYSIVTLYGNQNSNGWSLYTDTKGDNTGITFTITNTGQIQYTSTNQSNWTSTIFRYNAQQLSATGTYTSVLVNTQGSYIMSTVQLNDTTDAVAGVSNGPLYVLGGGTITKSLNVGTNLSATNATATNISAGTLIASTGLTTGTINATGLSTLVNATATNISAGTINATGLSALANATATNVSTGTINVTGLSALVNATATNISAGTINVTGLSALVNATATNISAGTLIASTGLTTGTINATGLSALVNATVTNVSAGVVIASTGITTGTINATGLSTFTNAVYTNVSTGTLIATTSVTSGLLSATNIVGNSISAGTLSATTITGANLSLSGNLSVAGTLTTVNITSTNMLNTNISAGTINATGLSSLQNVTLTNVSASTLNTSIGITTGSLRATGTSILANITATNISTGGLNATGTSTLQNVTLTNVSASTLNTSIGITTGSLRATGDFSISANSGAWNSTAGKGIFMRYSTVSGQDSAYIQSMDRSTATVYPVTIQGSTINLSNDSNGTSKIFINSTGNVGINTASPAYTLDVNGTARIGGNVGFKVFIVTGTHASSQGAVVNVALPSGCNRDNITMMYGVTQNTNGDVVPFNGWIPAEWLVGYYIAITGNIVVKADGSTTLNKTFKITIVTF